MFVRYQLWMLSDDGMYPHHTNDLEEALNIAFESPSFHSCDINFGVGMQVTVKTAEEIEANSLDFLSQQDYSASLRDAANSPHEKYEDTMKRLANLEKNEHVLESAHSSDFKVNDNTLHRYNCINMGINSCRMLLNDNDRVPVGSVTYNELHQHLDFIKSNLDKLEQGI